MSWLVVHQARELVFPDRERPDEYGSAACTECGEHTPRRLPERFPHICTGCLFPASLDRHLIGRARQTFSDQLNDLHRVVGGMGRFEKPFGHELRTGVKGYDR